MGSSEKIETNISMASFLCTGQSGSIPQITSWQSFRTSDSAGIQNVHSPLKVGLRFSLKAQMPSW